MVDGLQSAVSDMENVITKHTSLYVPGYRVKRPGDLYQAIGRLKRTYAPPRPVIWRQAEVTGEHKLATN